MILGIDIFGPTNQNEIGIGILDLNKDDIKRLLSLKKHYFSLPDNRFCFRLYDDIFAFADIRILNLIDSGKLGKPCEESQHLIYLPDNFDQYSEPFLEDVYVNVYGEGVGWTFSESHSDRILRTPIISWEIWEKLKDMI